MRMVFGEVFCYVILSRFYGVALQETPKSLYHKLIWCRMPCCNRKYVMFYVRVYVKPFCYYNAIICQQRRTIVCFGSMYSLVSLYRYNYRQFLKLQPM